MRVKIDGMIFNVDYHSGCKLTRAQPYEPDDVEIESVEVEDRSGAVFTLPDGIRKDLEKHYRDTIIEKVKGGDYE
jgi:hypothetical protein